MTVTSNKLQISAAVLLLLAGCGGGSDSPGTAVSASPAAPTRTTANTTTAASTTTSSTTTTAAATTAATTTTASPPAQTQGGANPSSSNTSSGQAPATTQVSAEKTAAAEQAAAEKAAAEKAAAEKAAAEKAAAEKAAAEKAAAEKAAAEKAAAEKAAAENSQQNSREVSNAGAAAGQQSEPPIIDTGARADLLATMLDQPTPSQLDQPGTVHAKPVDANGVQLPNEGNQIPWLINSQIREPGLSGAARGHAGNYAPAIGEYTYTSYNGGAYKPGNSGEADFNSGVNQVIQHVVIKNDHENKTLTLPADLIVSEKGKNLTYKAPGGSKKIKFANYITMNTALIQWNSDNGSNWVQLVIRKNGEQQADLCWIYHLPDTERMYCSRWGIPSNWSYGQALNYAGNYLSDKQRYWATDNIGSVNF